MRGIIHSNGEKFSASWNAFSCWNAFPSWNAPASWNCLFYDRPNLDCLVVLVLLWSFGRRLLLRMGLRMCVASSPQMFPRLIFA